MDLMTMQCCASAAQRRPRVLLRINLIHKNVGMTVFGIGPFFSDSHVCRILATQGRALALQESMR
eukprot:6179900-Alexandrium_andersonii.AAC.1